MNTITTLRNTLFETLNRLTKSSGDDLDIEVKKSKAIIEVSSEILKSASIEADIVKTVKELNSGFVPNIMQEIKLKQVERDKTPLQFNKSITENE